MQIAARRTAPPPATSDAATKPARAEYNGVRPRENPSFYA